MVEGATRSRGPPPTRRRSVSTSGPRPIRRSQP